MKFNIAKNKKLDVPRLIAFGLLTLAISMGSAILGVNRIITYKLKFKTEINQLEQNRAMLEQLSAKTDQYRQDILRIKSRWNTRVTFSNLLIGNKNFSYVEKLTHLEELLPVGVYISQINFPAGNQSSFELTFVAHSYENMIKAWSSLDPLHTFTVANQKESDGFFIASLKIRRKNVKN